MKLLDGKLLSEQLYTQWAEICKQEMGRNLRPPNLTAIMVDPSPASRLYVRNKERACAKVGVLSQILEFEATTTTDQLLQKIHELANEGQTDGLIVQLPVPDSIDSQAILAAIPPEMDVDGFSPLNQGRMLLGLSAHQPATPSGIMMLLKHYEIETRGKHAVVVGRSEIVGTPLAILLSRRGIDATVTLCHSRTADLQSHTRRADLLFIAAGQAELIGSEHIKRGAVVIDVGIHEAKPESGRKWTGDVQYDAVLPLVSAITPVPGGVGPMTVCALLRNTLRSWAMQMGLDSERF